MKKILVSTTSLAALATITLFTSAPRAQASDPKETFNAMRAGFARAAANGEIELKVVAGLDGTVTTSGTLDGQPLPPGIPIKTSVKRDGDTLDVLVELDVTPEQYESIHFAKNSTDKQVLLEVVPKGKNGRKSVIGVDSRSYLLTDWTEYQWTGSKYAVVAKHKYQPKLKTPAPKKDATAVRARVLMKLGSTASIKIGH